MHVALQYPVVVDAVPKRGTQMRKICGLLTERWEIDDVPVGFMVPAAEIEGRPTVMTFDGRYYGFRIEWLMSCFLS